MKRTRLVCAMAVALLVACEGRPPPGFDAVAAHEPQARARGCPDLSGTYEAPPDVVALLLGSRANERREGPSLLSFVRQDEAYIAVWHVGREAFMAELEQARRHDPGTYAGWRQTLLREGWTANADDRRYPFPIALAGLGPSLALRIGRFGSRCGGHWLQVAEADGPGPDRPRSVFLGRNRDGALLVRAVTYRTVSYQIWSAGTQRIRVGVDGVRWLKTPPAVDHDLSAFTDVLLPPGPTGPRVPPLADAAPASCPDARAELEAYRDRLSAQLPEGARLTAFHPESTSYQASGCVHMQLRIGVAVLSPEDVSSLGPRLLRERLVRDYEVLARETQGPDVRATLQVTALIGPATR